MNNFWRRMRQSAKEGDLAAIAWLEKQRADKRAYKQRIKEAGGMHRNPEQEARHRREMMQKAALGLPEGIAWREKQREARKTRYAAKVDAALLGDAAAETWLRERRAACVAYYHQNRERLIAAKRVKRGLVGALN